MKTTRQYLSDDEAIYLGFTKLNKKAKDRDKAQYRLTKEQVKRWKEYRNLRATKFREVSRKLDSEGGLISKVEKRQQKDLISVPSNHEVIRLSTNPTTGQQWVITEKSAHKTVQEIDFEKIVKKYITPVKLDLPKKVENNDQFDSLTFTDVHIGMEPDSRGKSMYSQKWGRDEIMATCMHMACQTISKKKSDILVVDELGDFLDGLSQQTTRGGHKLPQNMTDEEAFDLAVEFKVLLIDYLAPHYSEILVNNVCNDNHSGKFSYFANQMSKSIIESKYSHVKVVNHRTFISHYKVGKVLFLISHGKDDEHMKHGFKPQLDTKIIEKIDQYLKRHNLYQKDQIIIFKKGDSHQAIFDMAGSDDFFYYNYPALSPSSDWVKTNFKHGRRGYVIEHFDGLLNEFKPHFL